jgi:hypothetical protein
MRDRKRERGQREHLKDRKVRKIGQKKWKDRKKER